MSAGVLLITHPGVGEALIDTATTILGELPLNIYTISPNDDEPMEDTRARAEHALSKLETGSGLIILTDAYGATPGNLAVTLGDEYKCPVITGVNLPMLLRLMNYPYLPVDILAEKILEAAQDGILQATPLPDRQKTGKDD